MKRILPWISIILLVILGCSKDDNSGGGDMNPPPDGTTNTLTANAGPDQSIEEKKEVILDGSGSKDSAGEAFAYLWVFVNKPAASTSQISNADTVAPTFIADVNGDYEIQLTISNADFESLDNVKITVTPVTTIGVAELGGSITQDMVLKNIVDTPGVADYCVTSNIDLDAVLTIEPGVELHFEADVSFKVGDKGIIIAKGNPDNHIVFTAKDKAEPWRGIAIVLSDDFRNAMDYVDISYAGIDKISIVDRKAALGISSFSKLNFTNSSITNSASIGMYVDANVELTSFANNRFENNTGIPLVLPADQVGKLDAISQFSLSNGENIIEIHEGDIKLEEPTTWISFDDKTPYFVTDDIDINSQLNIEEGVVLMFDVNKNILVDDGILVAQGTAANPIHFTAKDVTLPWQGIGVLSDSFQNKMDYVEVSYAGIEKISILSKKAALGISSFAKFSITNSKFSHSVTNGVLISEFVEIIDFENNTFENNADTPLIISSASLHSLDANSQFGTTNGNDYVEVLGDPVKHDEEVAWTAFSDNTPYVLSGDLRISSGVNIGPKVTFLVKTNFEIITRSLGFISAKGGSEEGKITFTAFDKVLPWKGIGFLTDNIRNELDFVEVSYAGSEAISNIAKKTNVGVGAFTKAKVTNSILTNSGGYGIYLSTNVEINTDIETVNTFSGNVSGTVFFEQ